MKDDLMTAAATVQALHELSTNSKFRLWDCVEPPNMPSKDDVERYVTESLQVKFRQQGAPSDRVYCTVVPAVTQARKWYVIAHVDELRCEIHSDMYLGEIPLRAKAVLVDVARELLEQAEQRLLEVVKR